MALLKKWQNKCAQNERKIHDENSVSESAIEREECKRKRFDVCVRTMEYYHRCIIIIKMRITY